MLMRVDTNEPKALEKSTFRNMKVNGNSQFNAFNLEEVGAKRVFGQSQALFL
jgi:hypothetical protein